MADSKSFFYMHLRVCIKKSNDNHFTSWLIGKFEFVPHTA
jgi:hypothetical protein